jgi:valyl-tRNA synthetase
VGAWDVQIPLAGLFDVAAERARLTRELEKVQAELEGLAKRLDNPQFVDRAKPEVVAEARQRQAELLARREAVTTTLRSLDGA